MRGLILYTLILAALAYQLDESWLDPVSPYYLALIGTIGIWRYGWAAIHIVRAMLYLHIVFPRMRRKVEAAGEAAMPSHVYLMVTSFRIDMETTRKVYHSVFKEAVESGLRCTVVASLVEMGDQRLVKQLASMAGENDLVDLKFVRIAGTGKRDALAEGFRLIARAAPPPNAVVCVIDGDSILEDGALRRSLPFLSVYPNAGAFTTDEVCKVEGREIFRQWYSMRFAQRQILMSSHGLAKRVLTLTGRMSAFRADLVTDPEFVRQIEVDWIDHWRLGRLKFLTGDDKSSWFFLLRRGWQMLYIPDVRIVTIEHPPHNSFLIGSTQLMVRWFGNMLRTNGRALKLGPRKISWWTWWSIFDQRISMWTSLTGLVAAILASIFIEPTLILGYFYWVAFTRLLQTIALLTVRQDVSWTYPFLLYYNQIYGSIVKTYIFFRLDRQKWTRQNTINSNTRTSFFKRYINVSSFFVHSFAILALIVFVGNFMRALNVDSLENVDLMFSE